ncbi:MAG: hypothetical protein HY835_07240, partial [Anaerolineae bacterium]|nr:hypothetical protein [Anaerolineae bacterium]
SPSNISWALLAPLFLLLISNANGPLELLHASGAFWQRGADGAQTSSFWTWLDIQELNNPPAEPYRLEPNRPGGIWWWRSSRVLTDYDMNGAPREVIDEFPAFSFVLGDLHPHVLSIPFNLLAVGLALNLFLHVRAQKQRTHWVSGWVSQFSFWLAALALGGLAFLNTWDFPIYFGLYLGAFGLARLRCLGWRMQVVWEMLRLGILLGLAGILLYVPFYAGFSSQAGGLLPSLAFFTRGIHFWIMFLPLLLPILLWLIGGDVFTNRRSRFWRGLGIAAGLMAGLTALSYLFGWMMYLRPDSAAVIYNIQGGVESGMALLGSLAKRMAQPGMWMTMMGLLALVFAWVLREPGADADHEDFSIEEGGLSAGLAQPQEKEDAVPVNGFILLLVMGGAALVLVPEFFYLRDQFGWRMNTIFKFYYQAWILWGLAAGFASVWLWQDWRSRFAVPVRIVWAPLIAVCLVYLTYGVLDRTNKFNPETWSFNSANLVQRYQPDDYDAIQWIKSAPGGGAVAEAVGGSYSEFARVATFSGKPNVIGWPGHISQWRGGMAEAGSREQDLETLYTTRDWSVAQEIIARYQIRYVYVGILERTKYNLREEKFLGNMRVVYQNNSVTIYEAPVSLYTTR